MNSFFESGFNFEFSDDWNVIKYDDHRFYKVLSGQDMSGVDFAGLYNHESLFLIEIKNFKQYQTNGTQKPLDEFINDVVEKGTDSLRLIRVIKKHLDRKFWYKILFNLINRFSWINSEWFLWTEFYRIATIEKKAVFVLLIDSDYDQEKIESRLQEELLTLYDRVIVSSIAGDHLIKGLIVS